MPTAPSFHAIIVAGGKGVRAGLSAPKQYAPLAGRPVLLWSVDAFASHPACAGVVVVIPDGDEVQVRDMLSGRTLRIVCGGGTRQQSVAAGLAVLSTDAATMVMIHDAARPGVSHAVLDRLLGALAGNAVAGAIPALPVADTLAVGAGAQLGDVVPRDTLVRVQTPQAFRAADLIRAHARWRYGAASDDAQMVRRDGGTVTIVDGDPRLDKITQPDDLEWMERMMASVGRRTAVGAGYDVHRLVAGDGLWLGGIWIAHAQSLEGHSDADVLLHALTDAILGAIAEGDIGTHFLPSDPQWRGASSDQFLRHAANLVSERGGAVTHVDCTIICESPKIGPHRDAMRARIAAILGLRLLQVSVKATTSERLGFTGRGEGIAAQATASVELPITNGAYGQ